MQTPSEQRIEQELAGLRPDAPGVAPEAFLGVVRARRRVVLARRTGAVGATLLVLGAIVLAIPRPAAAPRTPIVLEPERPFPAAGQTSLAALRRAWERNGDASDWLPVPQPVPLGSSPPLRLGDAGRMLAGDL